MLGFAGGGDSASHGRMAEDEFQEKLCPRRAVDVLGPGRQGLGAHLIEQAGTLEWPVHQHSYFFIQRQWQQALLGRARQDRIIELHEVDVFTLDHPRQVVVSTLGVMRNTEVANAALRLPFAQSLEMDFPVQQIVHLHQIDFLRAQALEGFLHLPHAGFAPRRPHLGGEE